ncbi:MAG: Holliday junction resolvase RecU [Peptostreptococcaceae bacterium]|nr:Holliday junction resolvase RecU [Peptostreptococcaceae bacterium]
MTRWNSLNSRHRGDDTEELINQANEQYEKSNLALIKKMPVPIKVIEIDKKIITKAFFEEKSIVDYMGLCQGYPVAFDAKETNNKSLPLKNIHSHQIDFMNKFKIQGGFSFLIINFKFYKELYLLPIEILLKIYRDSLDGGRKSIPYKEMNKRYEIKYNKNGYINYLSALNNYIVDREKGILI